MTRNDDPFSDLEDLSEFNRAAPAAKVDNRPKHPCSHCGGSGRWVSPLGRKRGKCLNCQGRGWFRTTASERAKAAEQRAESKRKNMAQTREEFEARYPGLIRNLSAIIEWNSFASSLIDQHSERGTLSDKQANAALRMLAKIDAKRAEKAKPAAQNLDFAPIRAMFETAYQNGLKKAAFRGEGVKITRAPDHGRNPGALYVKSIETGEYLGKLIGTTYHGKTDEPVIAPPETKGQPVRKIPAIEALRNIADDPFGRARLFGQRTGICSCCGAELTNKLSIELGIGPICRGKWGF